MSLFLATRDKFGGCHKATLGPASRSNNVATVSSRSHRRPKPTADRLLDESAQKGSRLRVVGRWTVNQWPSGAWQFLIPSRSHEWVSIRVRGCKAFVSHIDCAPELMDRR